MTRRAAFSQSDVTRALRGVTAAGLPVGPIEVDLRTGKVKVHPPGTAQPRGRLNDFDRDFG